MAEEDWQELVREAAQLRRAGRVEQAIAAYKSLLAIKPDLPDSWYNLGWVQRQARAFDDALASYQRALDLGVREPEEVHLNRAIIYSDHLNQPEEAERELRAALEKIVPTSQRYSTSAIFGRTSATGPAPEPPTAKRWRPTRTICSRWQGSPACHTRRSWM